MNQERPSPSSPNLQAETRQEAGEGLDVTACSASSFDVEEMKIACSELITKLAKPENRESIRNDDYFWRLIHDFKQIVCDEWDEKTSPPLIRFN